MILRHCLTLAALAPLIAPLASGHQDAPAGSEAWYALELAWLAGETHGPEAWSSPRYRALVQSLLVPEDRAPLDNARRAELGRELVRLASAGPAPRTAISELLYVTSDLSPAGADHWSRWAEELSGPYWRSFCELNGALTLRLAARRGDALELLSRAQRTIDDALENGTAGDDTDALVDHRVWLLEERGSVYVDCGLAGPAAADFEAMWTLANARVEQALEQLAGNVPANFATGDVAINWFAAARSRLAVELLRRRFARLPALLEQIESHPAAELVLDEVRRARLRLRLGMGEVEGLRTGELPEARPVETLEGVLAVLGDELGSETFLARWWLARAQLDAGRLEEAEHALGSLRADFDVSDDQELDRFELQLVGLETAFSRLAGGDRGSALERIEGAFDDFLASWKRMPDDESGVGFLTFEEWNMVGSELILAHVAAEPGEAGVRKALERLLVAQGLGSLARRLGATVPTLEEVRAELLRPSEGLLVYWYGREHTHVFLLDGESLAHVLLGPDYVFDRARGDLLAALREVLDPAVAAPLDILDEPRRRATDALLPADVQAALARWSAVGVVGLDGLGFLPIDLLPLADGRALGNTMPLRVLPSLPVAWALHRRRESAGDEGRPVDLVVVEAARCGVPAARVADFTVDEADLAQLTRAYGADRARVLADRSATVAALRALDVGSARVAHLVVHGERDPARRRPAGLRLFGKGGAETSEILWAEDLEHGISFPELVIATTCGAARSPLRRGDDGVAHLGASFLLGGASTALVSYTDVDLHSSLELIQRVHWAIAHDGLDPAAALLFARRDAAGAADPRARLQHLLVSAVGLADRPLFEPRPEVPGGTAIPPTIALASAIAIGAALLVLAGWAVRRARTRPGSAA